MVGCNQKEDVREVEADLNVEFPELYDHPIPANRLVWKIFISIAGIGRLNVLVTIMYARKMPDLQSGI